MQDRTKLWCAVRIQDYRLTLLDESDEWADPGERTMISDDRETMFQAARRNGGLLMNVDGMPGLGAYSRFRAAVKVLRPDEPIGAAAAEPEGENAYLPGSPAAKAAAKREKAKAAKTPGEDSGPF